MNFYSFSYITNRDQLIPKNWKTLDNSTPCQVVFTKSSQASIYVRITLNVKFHDILWFSFTLATAFLSHTHKDRHFIEIVKSYSRAPKRVNPSKSGRRNFL